MSTGFFWICDNKYYNQLINIVCDLRNLGYKGRCGVLLLDSLKSICYASLEKYDIEYIHSNNLVLKMRMFPKSGLKLWLPFYFKSDKYIVIDCDIIVLNRNFIKVFQPSNEKLSLVRERKIFWELGLEGISEFHRQILGRNVFQTGVMSFSRNWWKVNFNAIRHLMNIEPSAHGDMIAINLFAYNNLKSIKSIDEEANLVLRPAKKGISTNTHLPFIQQLQRVLQYEGKPVLSVHYTKSDGKAYKLHDILSYHGIRSTNARKIN